ncbi:MAG: sigma-70 family RNA polymerase sigma factor [Balneolaceae bacterium]
MQYLIIYWLVYLVGFAIQSKDEEREWMHRIQNGDKEALRLLYRRYKNVLYSLILSILKSREEAEDCLQEVITQAWEKINQFDARKGNAYSFLITMARNKAIDRTRSRAFKDARKSVHVINDFTFTPESEENSPHENLELSERASLLRKALKKIDPKEREVLHVAYFQGLTQSEISVHMNIPLGTVKYRMRQGMIKLKALLIPSEIDE